MAFGGPASWAAMCRRPGHWECVSKLLLFAAGAELLRRQGKSSQGQRSEQGWGFLRCVPVSPGVQGSLESITSTWDHHVPDLSLELPTHGISTDQPDARPISLDTSIRTPR